MKSAANSSWRSSRIWPQMALAGIVIYIVIDIVLAFLRPDYSWLHNAESDYGRGPYFWLMDINFILRGLFSLALVKVLLAKFPKNKLVRQTSVLLVIWAVASGLLAFFADNPYGYSHLASGGVHIALAFVAFLAAVFAMVIFARRLTTLVASQLAASLLRALAVVGVVALVLLGHSGFSPDSFGGLYERIYLASVLAWEAVLALAISKTAE